MGDIPQFSFRWKIVNPFFPYRRMEATFYHGFPTQTEWKVILDPSEGGRTVDTLPYSFSLVCDNCEGDHVIITDIVSVKISVDKEIVERRRKNHHDFDQENLYRYEFQTSIKPSECNLTIEADLWFPRKGIVVQERRETFTGDVKQLSEDLRQVLDRRLYSNLRLESEDSHSNVPVHSYILQARWNNFFSEHPVDRTISNQTVQTDISSDILQTLLIYAYSGEVNIEQEQLKDSRYATELFEVMDKYGLHHFSKAFARDESLQVRETQNTVYKHGYLITVSRKDDGMPLESPGFFWQTTPLAGFVVTCKVKFVFSLQNPHFLFALQFPSPVSVHARVNLYYERTGARIRHHRMLFEQDYTVSDRATLFSLPCDFVSDSAYFNRFVAGEDGTEEGEPVKHTILFTLYLYTGEHTIQIWSEDDIGLQGGLESRLDLLSDHMYELMTRHDQADLKVSCPSENPDDPPEIHHLHKAIIAVRVPEWRKVLYVPEDIPEEDIPDDEYIPDELTCILSSKVFLPVIDYIYTGQVVPFPKHYITEILFFAEQGGMTAFEDLVLARKYSFYLDENYPPLSRPAHNL